MSPQIRHQILCLPGGVGVPMPSAILTVWKPDKHTILDRRAPRTGRLALDRRLPATPRPVGLPHVFRGTGDG